MALIMPPYEFPREMPLRKGFHPFESGQFEPSYGLVRAPTRGSRVQVVNVATPLWAMEFASHVMPHDEAQAYLAWMQSLRGGARLFKAWHPLCKYPYAYREGWGSLVHADGSTPFSGSGVLSSIGEQRDAVTVADLPAGFKLTFGDMLSIPLGATGRSLHRVMVPATANGLGVAVVTIEPSIPLSLAIGEAPPAVLFEKPWCLAVIDADSIRGPWQPGAFGRVSFSAVQTF